VRTSDLYAVDLEADGEVNVRRLTTARLHVSNEIRMRSEVDGPAAQVIYSAFVRVSKDLFRVRCIPKRRIGQHPYYL
jgi:hypothetical protein